MEFALPVHMRNDSTPLSPAQLEALVAGHAQLTRELEQRTRELEQSRSHFRDVIERNADAILVVDREGVIRFANAAAADLFRTPREKLAGTPFGFPVTTGETTELDLIHPDGVRVVEMRIVESEWEGTVAYIASLRDSTERRRAEDSARRLIREQAARSAAENAASRFRFQADASARLSAATDYAGVLTALASLCADEIADWAVVFAIDEQGMVRRVETAHCDPELAEIMDPLRDIALSAADAHPVLEVLRTRRPLLVPAADDARITAMANDPSQLEIIRRLGVVSYLIVPLIARGRALGALKLVSARSDSPFSEQDLETASDLAFRAGLALDNARLYEEAHLANQAKSDLLAVISHDLRTPLNAIIGYAEIMSMGIPEPLGETALHHVDRMNHSARHLLYLIDELSSFARLEAGRTELKTQDVSVDAVARDVADVIQPLAAERGLAFVVDVPDDDVTVRTDPDRLRQVLLNLLGNAVKYTEAGEVRLALERAPDCGVVFRVSDTGIGISADHLDRIFEPFWQVDVTQRANNRGTGLGLSIVRRIARMLDGDITVQSEPGKGSAFTLRLPPEPV